MPFPGSNRRSLALLATICCLLPLAAPISASAQDIQIVDLAVEARFQNYLFGHFKRGRPNIMADFDLDGRVDVFLGSLGEEGVVLLNHDGPSGVRYDPGQLLLTDEFNWGAAAADYDNDGDYDLFLTTGFGGGSGFNYLYRNMLVEEGSLRFEDVADAAGVRGAIPPGGGALEPVENASAVWGDYDRDGDVDLFVNVNVGTGVGPQGAHPQGASPEGASPEGADCHDTAAVDPLPVGSYPAGRNILWRNEGDGTFTDVTEGVGLGTSLRPTRHSTFFDADNDGDIDLYESNFGALNVLWVNQLVETGEAVFLDGNATMSAPGEDLGYPYSTFVSCSADFDQDGREDLVAFQRGNGEQGPYQNGHALFLNKRGGFVNVGHAAGLNDPYTSRDGVMGSMVGDVNGDGRPDVYIGNGGPSAEGDQFDQLFLSMAPGAIPEFVDRTDLIDFPAPQRAGRAYPTYPYRTHGTTFVDVDGDGTLEIAVANGGFQPEHLEPNRLFKLTLPGENHWLAVRPVGDGAAVSLDAIGTRIALTVSTAGGPPRTLFRTLHGGHCFSAQNGFELHFYVGDADTVRSLRVLWPDGRRDRVTGVELDSRIVVERTPGGARVVAGGQSAAGPQATKPSK